VPTRIAVEPLSLSSLHHVIRTRAGRVLARPVLRRVADASGGNPLLALGLVAALDQAPSPPGSGDPLPTPGTLIEVVAERVARLPAPSRDVLLIAASLASPTEALIARIAGGSVAGDIDAARAAGILDSLVTHPRFAHPLYAQAIRSLASPERRREVHGLIADLVAEPEEYARHRALAVPAPDDGVASALEAGASAALARGALRAAAELLDQARRFTPSAAASTGHERAFGAAELLILAGDRAAAGELLRDVVAHAASPVRERAMALYAEILVNQGALDEGERLFRSALGPDTPPSVAARIDLDLAYLSLVRLDTEEAARWADLGAVAARHGGEPALLAEALAYVALTRLLAGHEPDESQVADALAL
ncbi:MAG TPA: hypothetical protein VFI15_09735, partial [Candidatus Limnocylindrales bacterium]|nr:hypothetical protein [Candidatus Limnocylindrales bacterium]